jgi:hypothetical protein
MEPHLTSHYSTITHATILVQDGNGSADSILATLNSSLCWQQYSHYHSQSRNYLITPHRVPWISSLCTNWQWVVRCVRQPLTSKKKKAPLDRWTTGLSGPSSQSAHHTEEKNVCHCWNSSTLPQSSNLKPSNYTNYIIAVHASDSYQLVLFPEPAILKWVIFMCHGFQFSPTYNLWTKKLLSCDYLPVQQASRYKVYAGGKSNSFWESNSYMKTRFHALTYAQAPITALTFWHRNLTFKF